MIERVKNTYSVAEEKMSECELSPSATHRVTPLGFLSVHMRDIWIKKNTLKYSRLLKPIQCYFCVNQPVSMSAAAVMHARMPVLVVFPAEEAAMDYCRNVSGGYVSPMHRLVIHCIKTRLTKIKHTGCIQQNRIEAVLLFLIPLTLDNKIVGLLD